MARHESAKWRSARFSCQTIERVYGRNNFDDAGDAIVEALERISDYKGQYPFRFKFDSTHPNAYYHVMVFEIEGVSDDAYRRFTDQLIELGIVEENGQV